MDYLKVHISSRKPNSPLIVFLLTCTCLPFLSCVDLHIPVTETYWETGYVTENRTELFTATVPVNTIIEDEYALIPYVIWSNPDLVFLGNYKYLWYYGYDLSELPRHDMEKIRLTISEQMYTEESVYRVFDMTRRGQILHPPLIAPPDSAPLKGVNWTWISSAGNTESTNDWLNLANIKLNFARFMGGIPTQWMKTPGIRTLEFDLKGAREIAVLISGPTDPQNAHFYVSLYWSDNRTEYKTVTEERQVPYQKETQIAKQKTDLQLKQVPIWELLLPK